MKSILGIELSDAGIMAAAGDPPQLLEIEGREHASPGFAVSLKGSLVLGRDALRTFRINPRSSTNRFWDELGTDPIKQPGLEGKTHAELAYAHLEKLWDSLKHAADEVIIAVPGFYTQHQLGILLGITKALSMPVTGLVPIALAGCAAGHPRRPLLHLDIHLHRIEITLLEQGDHLVPQAIKTISGKGFHYLYTEWIRMVADEFVRTTRFDPFDQAAYEQELYDRLPGAIQNLQPHVPTTFSLQAGSHRYHLPLSYDLFAQKTEAVFSEVRRMIDDMLSDRGMSNTHAVLQFTHRTGHLPGCREALHRTPALTIVQLPPGSAAMGALQLRDGFAPLREGGGVILLSRRPWPSESIAAHESAAPRQKPTQPTHLLHGNYAHPLTDAPLIIGQADRDGIPGLHISSNPADVQQRFCRITREGNEILLTNEWPAGTAVDDRVILTTSVLALGQRIRAGMLSEELKLIACVDR